MVFNIYQGEALEEDKDDSEDGQNYSYTIANCVTINKNNPADINIAELWRPFSNVPDFIPDFYASI